MNCKTIAIASRRAASSLALRGLLVAGLAIGVAGCNTTARDTTGSVPNDYRQRHPISLKEGTRSLEIFVGTGRGGLSPSQRAEVLAFASNWQREGTGGLVIDRPVGSPNERAAMDTMRQVISILQASGIPSYGIAVRPYQPPSNKLATIRLNHPQIVAQAGPCGLWPEDLGPTYDPWHYENKPYFNLGCATQRNLAAQVATPADLVQPRAEAPVYTAKRTFGAEKWRRGESPATVYPDTQKGAISDLGK
jgi:pilus assembly protein CpaD